MREVWPWFDMYGSSPVNAMPRKITICEISHEHLGLIKGQIIIELEG